LVTNYSIGDDFVPLFRRFQAAVTDQSRAGIDKHDRIVQQSSSDDMARIMASLNQIPADLGRPSATPHFTQAATFSHYFSELVSRLDRFWTKGCGDASRFFAIAGFLFMKSATSGAIGTLSSCMRSHFETRFETALGKVNQWPKAVRLVRTPEPQFDGFSAGIVRFRAVCADDPQLVWR
jgi:hypothetical protein